MARKMGIIPDACNVPKTGSGLRQDDKYDRASISRFA